MLLGEDEGAPLILAEEDGGGPSFYKRNRRTIGVSISLVCILSLATLGTALYNPFNVMDRSGLEVEDASIRWGGGRGELGVCEWRPFSPILFRSSLCRSHPFARLDSRRLDRGGVHHMRTWWVTCIPQARRRAWRMDVRGFEAASVEF